MRNLDEKTITEVALSRHEKAGDEWLKPTLLVTAMADRKPRDCTEAPVVGPSFVKGAPVYQNGDDGANGAIGEPYCVASTAPGGTQMKSLSSVPEFDFVLERSS